MTVTDRRVGSGRAAHPDDRADGRAGQAPGHRDPQTTPIRIGSDSSRSRVAMGMTVLLLLFLEIASLLIVGSWIGVGWTLLLLLAGFGLGLALIGRGGREAMGAVNQAARSRQVTDDSVTGGFLTVVAGVLLMIPGFVSDLAALALLLPPVRALVRRRMQAWAQRSAAQVRVVHLGGAAPGMWPPAGAGVGGRRGEDMVVDGSVVDGSVVDGSVVDGSPGDPTGPTRSGVVERRPGDHPVG